jgi:DNA (cytosine-5)-methyltransferase 1
MTYLELFAGAGGMSLGLHRAGLEPAALVEWDRPAAGVLAHHWPDVPLFADVQAFTGSEIPGPVDLLAFGSPCQDLSIAGKRRGLVKDSGTRSSLFHHAIRIASHLRLHHGLRYLLWENVLGAFSSNQGADFASVLGEMGELGARDIAWRVLDAQWFGVPQRRRRVFVVCDLGGERAAEILSLAQGLLGDSPPRREAGQRPSGRLSARTQGGGGLGTDSELDGGLVAARMVAFGEYAMDGTASTVKARDYKDATDLVAHTLRGEGFDASEDGTGRGTPLVAFSCKDYGADAGEIAPTVRAMGHAGSHANAGGQVAVCFRSGVRRLTPRECERLMGWPDDHTLYSQPLRLEGNRWVRLDKPPKEQADGPRYKQCGNGVVASVAQWIGQQITDHS